MVGKVYCVLTFFLGLWNEFTDEVKHFLCFSTIYSYNLKNEKKNVHVQCIMIFKLIQCILLINKLNVFQLSI